MEGWRGRWGVSGAAKIRDKRGPAEVPYPFIEK